MATQFISTNTERKSQELEDQAKYKPRAVGEKKAAKMSWKNCIDSLMLEGEEAKNKSSRMSWRKHVANQLTDYLAEPQLFINRFEELTKHIGGPGKAADAAVKAGNDFLKAKRDTLAAHELA